MHIVANQQFETCVTNDVIIFYALNHFQMTTFEILHFLSRSFAIWCTLALNIVNDIGFRFEIQMIPIYILYRFNDDSKC